MRITHKTFFTHPAVIHFAGRHLVQVTSVFRGLASNAFANITQQACEQITLLTWNNGSKDPKQRNLGTFEESCGWFGQPIHALGKGIDQFRLSQKTELVHEFLKHVSTPYILAADSNDCILLDYPVNILREYLKHFSCEMVISAGGNHPTNAELAAFEMSLPWARCVTLPGINSGSWIGRTEFVREYFSWCMERYHHLDDDQLQLRYGFRNFYPRVQIDYLRVLFHRWGDWNEVAWEI